MAGMAEEAPGHAQYLGEQHEGVWRPQPEDSFRAGYGDVPGLMDGEKRAVWDEGIALFQKARSEGMSEDALRGQAVEVIENVFLPVTAGQVAPHVLGQFQISQYVRGENEAAELYKHYEHNTNRLKTAVLLPKPKPPQKPQSQPEDPQETDSQAHATEVAETETPQKPSKGPAALTRPASGAPSSRQEAGASRVTAHRSIPGAEEENPEVTLVKTRDRPVTRQLLAGEKAGAGGPTKSVSAASQGPQPEPWNTETLSGFILEQRKVGRAQVVQELGKLLESYVPPSKPKPNPPPVLSGYCLQSIAKDFPGLSETDTPGQSSILISQGNPMPGTDGISNGIAARLATWAKNYPQGQNPSNGDLIYSSFNEAAFKKLAKQVVEGPTAVGEAAGMQTEVGKFVFLGGRNVSDLECNEFVPALFLHKDTKGGVILSRVGEQRNKEDLEKFRPALDNLTAQMGRHGGAMTEEKLKAHKAPATDSSQKIFHTLPIYFPVAFRMFLPPRPTADGKLFKFHQWRSPRAARWTQTP